MARSTGASPFPPTATATVYVPATEGASVREGDAPAEESTGVRLLRREGDVAVYEVGAGTYHFTAG